MTRRTLTSIVVVAAVATLAAAVPALGGPAVPSLVAKAIKKVDKRAKKAERRARSADKRALQALAQSGRPAPEGPQGPQGQTGPQGATGPQGPVGISDPERVIGKSSRGSDSVKTAHAFCPAGKRVISTGAHLDGEKATGNYPNMLADVVITTVSPDETLRSAQASAYETHAISRQWEVWVVAVCARVG